MNKNPEQLARDKIDNLLEQAGWTIQSKNSINHNASLGIAIREYQTDKGFADYILFVDKKPIGVIEAKKEDEAFHLTSVEEQSNSYANSKLKWINNEPLPFIYESTGEITRFTDARDPKPQSREIFNFHKPETLKQYLEIENTLRKRLLAFPSLKNNGLRECQFNAVSNLEKSFGLNQPRALIQMATGAGKTYTAITFIYRLLKFAGAKRVLFLVDTKNLGEQAEKEFMAYKPQDDTRQFTELYNIQRLKSSYIGNDYQVCISTIQRMYSILTNSDLNENAEDISSYESQNILNPKEVSYNPKIPIEFFDFIVIDECHRSIYNLWQQVLDYFDAFLIGLTATPDKRTFGFFKENIVSEYTHDDAVADGVNVPYEEYIIETDIIKNGSKIEKEKIEETDGALVTIKQVIEHRDKMSRKKVWKELDDDIEYKQNDLDRKVVNKSTIRNIIKEFKNKLPILFPDRKEVPKTLIFAKNDSHADDIIQIVREVFGEENKFCKKITYQAKDAKETLQDLRNDYFPRIAVTVDMIATGTDVKPLEVLIFMRNVKSRNYYEQMKGRGTRICDKDTMNKAGTDIYHDKTHFIIIDAIGVTETIKTDSQPLERKKSVSTKDLMMTVLMGGADDEDTFRSIAARLARLNKELTLEEKNKFKEKANISIEESIHNFLNVHDIDKQTANAKNIFHLDESQEPTEDQIKKAKEDLIKKASNILNGEIIEYITNVRKDREQIIDNENIDSVVFSGWKATSVDESKDLVKLFTEYLNENKDEIQALSIFYNEPYKRRDITYNMLKSVLSILKENKPTFAPLIVWEAFERIKQSNGSPKNELSALVGLIRYITKIDSTLTPLDKTVNKNFQDWIFKKHSEKGSKFTEEQLWWLRNIRDHISTSSHFDIDDFEYAPFDSKGGIGGMYETFGEEMNSIINELNEELVS